MIILNKRLKSKVDLEGLSRSGYELLLMVSCLVIEYIRAISMLTNLEIIRTAQKLSIICDFIRRELQRINELKVDIAPRRRLNLE